MWQQASSQSQWFRDLDRKFVKNIRKVLLILVDNCSAHVPVHKVKNIKVQFLPASTTSILQPYMIIRALKAHFRHAFRYAIVEAINEDKDRNMQDVAKSIHLLNAMDILKETWTKITGETIRNYWMKGGFVKQGEAFALPAPDSEVEVPPPPRVTEDDFNAWVGLNDGVEVADDLTLVEYEEQLINDIKEKEHPSKKTIPSKMRTKKSRKSRSPSQHSAR